MSKPILALIFLAGFSQAYSLPAFPGAEGWGAETPGGRGGKVYVVTNLNASGPGSFQTALIAKEPRIIVFRVSGVLPLDMYGPAGRMNDSAQSWYTIAGQTSPGGVTIRGGFDTYYDASATHHNYVIRHVRFRFIGGDFTAGHDHDFILDHCDFSGGGDETTDFYYASRFTVQWSTICNSETEGTGIGYAKGTIISHFANRITFHHVLWAHHGDRAPLISWHWGPVPDYGLIDYRNNIIYDIMIYSFTIVGASMGSPGESHVNIVGNTFKWGPSAPWISGPAPADGKPYLQSVVAYDRDNACIRSDGFNTGGAFFATRYASAAPAAWDMPAVTTHSRDSAFNLVLAKSGALPEDPMNLRTDQEVRNGTGVFGKVDDPLLNVSNAPPAPPDGDMDGMPDCWESAMGLNPNLYADNALDKDGDGYTNIEEYINDLALVLEGKAPHNLPLNQGCPAAAERHPPAPGSALSLFPNPFRSTISVKTKGPSAIYDVSGKVVFSTGEREYTWNARHLPEGIFFLKSGRHTQKLILMK